AGRRGAGPAGPLIAVPAQAVPTPHAASHVIVRFAGAPAIAAGLQAHALAATLHTDHADFARHAGVKITHDFTQALNAVAVTTGPPGVARARPIPGVPAPPPDRPMHVSVDPDVSLTNAPQVWQNGSGFVEMPAPADEDFLHVAGLGSQLVVSAEDTGLFLTAD